jgi:hypothetical protein
VAEANLNHRGFQDCCRAIRLEGKYGVKHIRILYDELSGYEDLVDKVLERYLPDNDGEMPKVSNNIIRIKDISDPTWPFDIENTNDLSLAVKYNFLKATRQLKMKALISSPKDTAVEPHKKVNSLPTTVTVGVGSDTSAVGTKQIEVAKAPKKRKVGKPTGSKAVGGKLSVRAKIIGALAELRALGTLNPPCIEVAMFAGYGNANSKGFVNPLSALRTEGLVMYPDSKTVSLTTKGLESEEAKGVTLTPPRNNMEVQSRITVLLKPKQVAIFDKLADGRIQDRDELVLSVGYTNMASKGFSNDQ